MMSRQALALLLLGLLVGSMAIVPIRAQDDGDDVDDGDAADEVVDEEEYDDDLYEDAGQPPHPLTNLAESSPDVETDYKFVKYDGDLPLGEEIACLCTFTNKGEVPLNVSFIMGSVNSHFNFNHYVANFSGRPVNTIVESNQEVSFVYGINADPTIIDPFEYRIAFTIFYENDEEIFTTTFFNETRTFYEPSGLFDGRTMFTYLLGAAVVGVGVLLFNRGGKSSSTTSSGPSTTEEWLPDMPKAPTSGKRARKRNSSGGKRKSKGKGKN